jgi:hypothetical protein
MPSPRAMQVVPSEAERVQLESWSSRRTSAQALAMRSRIVATRRGRFPPTAGNPKTPTDPDIDPGLADRRPSNGSRGRVPGLRSVGPGMPLDVSGTVLRP